jgi:hypothetical protein
MRRWECSVGRNAPTASCAACTRAREPTTRELVAAFVTEEQARQHRKAAAAVKIEQRLHAEAEPLSPEEAQPHHVLKDLLAKTGGRLRWLDEELAREHSATADRLFKEERQFLAWISKMCSEARVEQVTATIQEAQATLMADTIKEAFRLAGLSDEQVKATVAALRLVSIEGSGETPPPELVEQFAQACERWKAADAERVERLAREEAQRLSGLTLPPSEWVEEPTSPTSP